MCVENPVLVQGVILFCLGYALCIAACAALISLVFLQENPTKPRTLKRNLTPQTQKPEALNLRFSSFPIEQLVKSKEHRQDQKHTNKHT